MAHVIDRLRVRGVSATGNTNLQPFDHKSLHICENIPPSRSKTDIDRKCRHIWKTGDNSRHDLSGLGFSSATRRMEHMQRVRAAYNGLSTMDSAVGPPSVQFVLQGKNMKPDSTSNPKLMMSTGLTGNDNISHKSDSGVFVVPNMKVRKAKSEPPGDINGKDKKHEDSNSVILPSFPATCISLAPPSTPIYLNNYMSNKSNRSAFRESFEIMGHKVRSAGANDEPSMTVFPDPEPMTPRPSRKWTRTLFKEGSSTPIAVSAQSLNQCLHVQQSNRQLHNDLEQDAIKLKHFTQFVRNDGKINYINPYRQAKSRERKPLVRVSIPNKYNFSSVNSYVHFNKIYPPRSSNSKINAVPQMSGFPAHCTDTVMLKMMVEMNRPKLQKSQTMDKYSDIGMQQDLEEYLMVRSPSTVSKPPSSYSKRQGRGLSSKSLASNTEVAVEEEGTCVWAGNNVQEDVENVEGPIAMETT